MRGKYIYIHMYILMSIVWHRNFLRVFFYFCILLELHISVWMRINMSRPLYHVCRSYVRLLFRCWLINRQQLTLLKIELNCLNFELIIYLMTHSDLCVLHMIRGWNRFEPLPFQLSLNSILFDPVYYYDLVMRLNL